MAGFPRGLGYRWSTFGVRARRGGGCEKEDLHVRTKTITGNHIIMADSTACLHVNMWAHIAHRLGNKMRGHKEDQARLLLGCHGNRRL